jgi:hypothetical protein
MGLLGVARANTVVGASSETFLLLLLLHGGLCRHLACAQPCQASGKPRQSSDLAARGADLLAQLERGLLVCGWVQDWVKCCCFLSMFTHANDVVARMLSAMIIDAQ